MGFDLGHTISSLSKLALRTKRRLDNSSNNKFEILQGEFNNLMKKYQGYAENKNFKVGLNGTTIHIFDKEEKELAKFQDATYMYRGKFIPNTNIIVVKATSGFLLFYDLDKLELIKKIKFSNIGSQDENFDITSDGKYLYNIEAPKLTTRTQLTKYDLKTFKPVISAFYDLEKVFLKYIETDKDNIYLLGYARNEDGVKDYSFIGLYKELGDKCGIQGVKKLSEDLYDKIYQYKICEDYGFTEKELKYQHLEKIDGLEKITLKDAYNKIIINKKNDDKKDKDFSVNVFLGKDKVIRFVPGVKNKFGIYVPIPEGTEVSLNSTPKEIGEIYLKATKNALNHFGEDLDMKTASPKYISFNGFKSQKDFDLKHFCFSSFDIDGKIKFTFLPWHKNEFCLLKSDIECTLEIKETSDETIIGNAILEIIEKANKVYPELKIFDDNKNLANETINSILSQFKDKESFMNTLKSEKRDIISHIISHEDEEIALKVLCLIDDVNKEDKYENTYLTFACTEHKVNVIEKLLIMGADPNHKSIPLLNALGRKNKNNSKILELFIKYGVNLKMNIKGKTLEEKIRLFEDEELNKILNKKLNKNK